jgi:predicted phosphodiesterase
MKPEAITCADLHFTMKPPIARSTEESWLKVQKGYIQQLTNLQTEYGGIPIICTGDIFDSWKASCELVNFLIEHSPVMYAVAGNHDLPYHSYADIKKSSYWTLVEAGKVINLEPGKPRGVGQLILHGFPYGSEVKTLKKSHDLALEVAVIHALIWTEKTGFDNAPAANRLGSWMPKLKGYDVALFGDNHKTILKQVGELTVFNAGGFQRRKISEKNHKPVVGLLYNRRGEMSIEKKYLDCSRDKFIDSEKMEKLSNEAGFGELIEELSNLGDVAIDFGEAVRRLMERRGVNEDVKRLIDNLLNGKE